MADDLIISGWKPAAKAPLLNSMLSLLDLSSSFCRFQVTREVESFNPRLESYLRSGAVQGRLGKAVAEASSPQEKRRILKKYDEALEHARTTRLPLKRPFPAPPPRPAPPKNPLSIRPGGSAKEPSPSPKHAAPKTAPTLDTFARRWKR